MVDMDIRKPSIMKRFNIQQSDGVTNYLIGETELDDVILHLPDVNFDILPAGTIPPNSGELIRSEKLVEMFKILRKKYDYIIVDTSPIGIVADAYSISFESDINLFLARNNKTNKSFYKKISNQLSMDKVPNFYTIINDVSIEENRYSKYYSKKYTYGYGYGYGYGYTGGRSKRGKDEANKYFQYYQDDQKF
jgi:capsular exopolysaccharide synthesis family protein